MIEYKEITEEGLPGVKEIYDWYILNSTATFHTEPIKLEQLKEFIYFNHPLYKGYFIIYDGQVAGYCQLTNYKKRQAYDRTAEVTLYLKPDYCRKGIGTEVLRFLESEAVEKGIKNLMGIIAGDNEGSIALFKKAGYTQCAHFRRVGEKFGLVLDVVAFQKLLDE
jgi:L-amino acid N-acyltransferase YncA